jgi:NADH-quinone oxidoreductase subunit E
MSQEIIQTAQKIIEKYKGDPTSLIAILLDYQETFSYLPKEALEQVSEAMNIPLPRIYSIATFFKAFSLKPKGKYSIHVCMGTACHVKGADKIAEKFERELGIKEGDTTPDLMFSLHKVYCVGCCGLAPVVMVNEDVNAKVTIQKVPSIIKKYKK